MLELCGILRTMLRSQFYQRTRFTSETRLAQSAFTFHPHVLAPCTFPCMLRGLFWLSFFGPSHLITPIFAISRRPSTSCAAEVFLNTFGNVSLELGGVLLEYLWSTFGVLLQYFWGTWGVLLEYFWNTFGEYFWGVLLEYFWNTFGILLEYFWSTFGLQKYSKSTLKVL